MRTISYRQKRQKNGTFRHFVYWRYKSHDGKWMQGQLDILYPPTEKVKKVLRLSELDRDRRAHRISVTPWLKKHHAKPEDDIFLEALRRRLNEIRDEHKSCPPRPPRWERKQNQKARPQRNLFADFVYKANSFIRLIDRIEATDPMEKWPAAKLEEFCDHLEPILHKVNLARKYLINRPSDTRRCSTGQTSIR